MYRPYRTAIRHVGWAALAVVAACGAQREASQPVRDPAPRAEFLMVGNDSTYWISTTEGRPRVRGEPLILARYGGRWYEVYSADDDHSYDDASLVGTRLYRRDIVTGDSAIVFADTTVPRIAAAYARAHPDERPLGPDEDGEDNPSQEASADLDILDVFGPYVSYEYRVDVSTRGGKAWRSTRRGVIDLRSGKPTTVGDLFGARDGDRVVEEGRRTYQTLLDSVAHAAPTLTADERRAAEALSRQRFDDHSFSVTTLEGHPAVAFQIPGRGEGVEGNGLELEPVAVSADWSPEPVSARAATDSMGNDHWDAAGYRVIARYDTTGAVAHLSIADTTNREWPLASVGAPLHRVDWLDRPPVSADDRQALVRAFNAASMYGEPSHVALSGGENLQLARHDPLPTSQGRSGKPARILGAHVAPAREQPGTRLRRRGSFDDGQDGGHRRVQAQPRGRGHGVDRPRRFSRADSPRRPPRDEGQRELGGTNVDGSGRPR